MALSLKIDLEARFAQALDSFDKLEKQATRSMRRIDSAVGAVNTALGALGVGISVGALASSFKSAVDELVSLKDASEATGSSVETISAALNTLRAAGGGGLETILELTDRLGRSMATVDGEGSRAAQAFKTLGLNIDQLKTQGRVDSLLDLARAQAKFAESGEKSALIDAALGRGAASRIADLNDLAETTLEAATATGKIVDEADLASKAISKFQARLIVFRNDIAIKVLPIMNEFLIRARAFQDIGSNTTDFFTALFGDDKAIEANISQIEAQINKLRDAESKLQLQREEAVKGGKNPARPPLGASVGRAGALPLGDAFGLAGGQGGGQSVNDQLSQNSIQLQKLKLQLDQQRALLARRKAVTAEFAAAEADRPKPDGGGGNDDDKKPKAAAISEADKLLRKTIEQLIATEKLSAAGKAELQIALAGYPQKVAGAQELALSLTRQIDLIDAAAEAQKRASKEFDAYVADLAKAEEIERRRVDTVDPDTEAWQKVADIIKQIRLGPIARDLAADKAAALFDAGGLSIVEYDQILFDLGLIKEATDKVKEAGESMLAPIESAFEAMILQGGKARDIITGLANDIAQLIIRSQITGPLFEILGGKATKASVGGTLVGSLFGFAGGGDPPVGRWSVVGEKGPELIRPLSAVRVYPNGYGPAGGGGVTVNQTVNVGSGVNRTEVAQAMYAAKEAAKAEILASMRRGSTFAAA